MSKFDQLETFALVVELNSFAKAAQALNITPAAVSKQIQALEKNIGAQLLYRTTRHLSLTEIGNVFYEHCQRIFSEVREAEASVSTLKNELTGNLKIVANAHFSERYIMPFLPDFIAQHKHLSINIDLADYVPDLNREKIDILIGVIGGNQPELSQYKLLETRLVLAASPDYLSEHGTPTSVNELSNLHYISHSRRLENQAVPLRDRKDFYLKPHLTVYNAQAMLACALKGMGMILVPEYAIKEYLESGQLQTILSDKMPENEAVYVYYPKSQYMQPKVKQFIEFVANKIDMVDGNGKGTQSSKPAVEFA